MATITLTVPNAVATRIVTMMRDEYASLIPAGTIDSDVVKIVLRFWIKKKLGLYEGQIQRAASQVTVNTAIADQQTAEAAAVANAEAAADTIT